MKINYQARLRCFSQWYFYGCLSLCLLVTSLPYWPSNQLFTIPKYALLFGPRWWLLLAVIVLVFFWRQLSKKQLSVSILLLLLSLNYLDFQLPKLGEYFIGNDDNADVTILSANIGGGGSKTGLNFLAKNIQPDLILLQEARRLDLSSNFTDYPFADCVSGLCILSKYPFKQIKKLDRKLFGGWGSFAVFYSVETEAGAVSLANVHFETPRSVLMGLIHRTFDFQLANSIESNRKFQAELVSLWSENKSHTLIVGDFNMPVDENIYQDNFSKLNNAIDAKGFAFNDTKHTFWHGIRIDHVLYSDDFQLLDVEVVNSLSGDHRPVLTRLKIQH